MISNTDSSIGTKAFKTSSATSKYICIKTWCSVELISNIIEKVIETADSAAIRIATIPFALPIAISCNSNNSLIIAHTAQIAQMLSNSVTPNKTVNAKVISAKP